MRQDLNLLCEILPVVSVGHMTYIVGVLNPAIAKRAAVCNNTDNNISYIKQVTSIFKLYKK